MKKLHLTVLCGVLALAVVQGCHSSSPCSGASCTDGGLGDAGTGDAGHLDAGPRYSIDTACNDFYGAYCAYLTRCGAVSSESLCDGIIAGQLPNCFFPEAQAVKHGRASFDVAAMATCVDTLHSTTVCNFTGADLPGCAALTRGFVTGTVQDGNPCYASTDCSAASYCTSAGSSVCPGTCTPRLASMVTANFDVQCQSGLYVYGGKCEPLAHDQSSCAASGGPSYPQTCVAGDFCDPAGTVCTPIRAPGGSCASSANACGAALHCTGTTCEALQPVNTPCGAGGHACQADLACIPAYVDGGSPTCKTPSPSNPCVHDLDCGPNFYCAGSSASSFGSCVAQGSATTGCNAANECKPGLFCDSTHHCTQPAGVGQACDNAPVGGAPCGNTGFLSCTTDGGSGYYCNRNTACGDLAP